MDTDVVVLMILFVASNLLLIGLSIPLILRRIPPNGLYGFRVPATLKNEALWYDVNAFAGERLLVAGAAGLAASVGFGLIPFSVDAYSLLCLGIELLFLGWTVFTSLRFLSRQTHRDG